MKKLMFAAAALVAGFAMAEEIVSANIVGYAKNDLQQGFSFVTPQFMGIGKSMDLQDLKAVGDEASDNVVIQTLDYAGRTLNNYNWNEWACDYPCWVNDDNEEVKGVAIEAGQGLCVQGLNGAQALQSAGEVGNADVVVALRQGFTFTGNPFPVSLDLQDIIAEGDEVSDNVVIQTLDYAGRTLNNYNWNEWACEYPCWVNDDNEEVKGVSIAPGQGLGVQGLSDQQSIRFPAPEL